MALFAVAVEGLESLRDLKEIGPALNRVAAQAINKIARDGRVDAARRIRDQLNIPASRVRGRASLLTVSEKANRNKLQAKITARGRPTSLANYVKGNPRPGRAGIRLEVKPGQASFMGRAFLIRLPQGSTLTETQFNLGLAMRLRPGERLENKARQVQLSRNLVLLYGPSVQQIFLDNQGKGVADDLADPLADDLEREVIRLLELDR